MSVSLWKAPVRRRWQVVALLTSALAFAGPHLPRKAVAEPAVDLKPSEASGAELLQLMRSGERALELSETMLCLERLLAGGEMELKDEFVQEILSFQVQALHTADMELVLRAAALGQELKQQGQGALLDAAAEVLKHRKLRVADLRPLLEAPLAGIAELRSVALSAAKEVVHRMSPEVVVSVMHLMATYEAASEGQEELLADLLDRAEMKSFRFSPQEGLQLLDAMVKLNEYNGNLLSYFTSQAALDISPYSVQELCTWADIMTRLNFRNQKLLSILAKAVTWKSGDMSPSELNSLLRCFSHFRFQTPAVEEMVARLRGVPELSLKELGKTMLALAEMQHSDNDFFALAAERLMRASAEVKDLHDISVVAIGLAMSGYRHPELPEALELLAPQASVTDLSRLAYAFVAWGYPAKLQAVSMQQAQPKDLARLAWSLATLGSRDPQLLESLKTEATKSLARFQSPFLADLTWAFAQMEMLDALQSEIIAKALELQDWQGEDWMTLILSLKTSDPKLLSHCSKTMRPKLKQQSQNSLFALRWLIENLPEEAAVAKMSALEEDIKAEVSRRKLQRRKIAIFTPEGGYSKFIPGRRPLYLS